MNMVTAILAVVLRSKEDQRYLKKISGDISVQEDFYL